MGKKLWITISSFLMLILRFSLSQPNTTVLELRRLQTHLIVLYEQYGQNASAVDLERFMDSQLMTRTHGIIDLIRGWSYNESEELINVRTSMNYIRAIVLYTCIAYADSSYDLYFNVGGLDLDAALYATEIYQIRSNFVWAVEPEDEIVRSEIAQFHQFGVRLRPVNNAPYVQLSSTNAESARFFDDMSALNAIFSSFGLMPLRQDPQANLLREVRMLTEAQNIVLKWNIIRIRRLRSLSSQLFFLNPELRCVLQESIITFTKQRDPQSWTRQHGESAFRVVSLIVLQRYILFVNAEYDRHVFHPAHIKYAYVLSANVTTPLNKNHIKLEHAYQEIATVLNVMTNNNDFLSAVHSHFSALSLRVGYVQYNDGQLALRIALSCQEQLEN